MSYSGILLFILVFIAFGIKSCASLRDIDFGHATGDSVQVTNGIAYEVISNINFQQQTVMVN